MELNLTNSPTIDVFDARRLRCDVITWSSLSVVLDAAGRTMELRRSLEELRRFLRNGVKTLGEAWNHGDFDGDLW